MNRARQLLSAGAAVATTVASTLVLLPPSPAVGASGRVPIPVTHVYITASNHIRMSTHLRAGMREFVINAANHSSFQLAKARPGYSKVEAVRDIRRGLDQGSDLTALRRFEANVRFLGGVNAGPKHTGHMWRVMHAGRFWALETSGNSSARLILTLHVGGSLLATQRLHRDAQIRAVRDVRWAHLPRSIPHAGVLEFTNDSADNHVLVMIKLAKGKTIADFRRWVNGGFQGRPPFGDAQFSFGALSPNSHMTGSYSQPRGKYVLLCFWPDADHHGMPHFAMGMYRGIRLV